MRVPLQAAPAAPFLSGSKKWALRMSDDPKGEPAVDDKAEEAKPVEVVAEAAPQQGFDYFKETDIMDDSARVDAALGLGRGVVLLAVVMAVNVWFFSIPPEFRRTRLCSDMDTVAHPERCMTTTQFTQGIADYYSNGKDDGCSRRRKEFVPLETRESRAGNCVMVVIKKMVARRDS
jgi:hypothetical protein